MRLGLNDLSNLGDLYQLMSDISTVPRDAPTPAMSCPLESQGHFVPFSRTVIHRPASLTLQEALAGLLSRMRNAVARHTYLAEFTGSDLSDTSTYLAEP